MFGLAVLFFIALYLAFLAWVARGSYRYALHNGTSKRQAIGWGFLGGFVVWLAVFWDWIPTEIAYRYYCEKEAGVQVFKTLEQWKKENPVVGDAFEKPAQDRKSNRDPNQSLLTQRFALQFSKNPEFLSVTRFVQSIVDLKSGEELARSTTFFSGHGSLALGGPGSWKGWLSNASCKLSNTDAMADLERAIKRAEN